MGYDNVDWRLARKHGIDVANVPDYGTEEVADSAIGMMLALTRGITCSIRGCASSRANGSTSRRCPIWRLRGRVFGIIGLGRIGTAAALRAKALGMDVVFYDPYVPDGRDKSLGVRRVETLDELLAAVARAQPALPADGRDASHDRRGSRSPRCRPARSW